MARKRPAKALKTAPKISADEFIARVRMKAYELFEKRNYTHGNDLEDWLKAESIVKKELGIKEK
jgi:Protein of unknown function (DUF2934)